MNQLRTHGIVLTRVDYGEADRIITVLTPDVGKLTLIAKGVRRVKSKLAGGIELFSVSEITYIQGRGSVSTLISARLQRHYGHIVTDIERTMAGYELIKVLNKVTEDESEVAYYTMLEQAFSALDDATISLKLIQIWFNAQLLTFAGHIPNLVTATDGTKLQADARYIFDFDAVALTRSEEGSFGVNEIKFLRLLFAASTPKLLSVVDGAGEYAKKLEGFVTLLRQNHLRI